MKGAQPQVKTTAPSYSPGSKSYLENQQQLARNYASQNQFTGPSKDLTDALAGLNSYATAGRDATAAFGPGGDPSAFLTPQWKALDPIFAQLNEQAGTNAAQQATRAGAFGGSRADVSRAVAEGNIANQRAQLGYQGFNDARNFAQHQGDQGLQALGMHADLAKYLQFLPQLFQSGQLGLLNQGFGPAGSTETTPMSSSPWQQLFGAGLSLAPTLLGPGGWLGKTALTAAKA